MEAEETDIRHKIILHNKNIMEMVEEAGEEVHLLCKDLQQRTAFGADIVAEAEDTQMVLLRAQVEEADPRLWIDQPRLIRYVSRNWSCITSS